MKKRFIRFGVVGVFNTLSNLLIFNIFIFVFGLSVGIANAGSVTISICISFVLNAKFVFAAQNTRQKKHHTYALFFVSSLFSQMVVQQLVVIAFVNTVTGPGDLVHSIAIHLPVVSTFPKRFYIVNTAKIIAVVASMLTNYLLYDRIVFASKDTRDIKSEEVLLG